MLISLLSQMDKRHTFEDPRPQPSHQNNGNVSQQEQNTTALSAQDWLETLSRAKEIALSQTASSNPSSAYPYSAVDDVYNNLSSSAMSSHASTLDGTSDLLSAGMTEGSGGVSEIGRVGMPVGERGFDRIERNGERGNTRAMLQKHHSSQERGVGGDGDSIRSGGKSKRFSKRQSKTVLAAVF